MDGGDIGMVDAGRGPGFSKKTAPGRFVTEELPIDDLESHRAPEVGINRFIGNSHAAMPELEWPSVLVSKNVVMLETKFGRGIRRRFAMARQVRD